MDTNWLHPREELVRTMERIYRYRMTTTSGGNLSIRDPDGSIWITPSRVDKGRLQATDIVRVQADGQVEGLHPASSEYPFHREIYRSRPDIGAIVHAHPGALVAFSIVRQLPDTRVQTHVHEVCGKVAGVNRRIDQHGIGFLSHAGSHTVQVIRCIRARIAWREFYFGKRDIFDQNSGGQVSTTSTSNGFNNEGNKGAQRKSFNFLLFCFPS